MTVGFFFLYKQLLILSFKDLIIISLKELPFLKGIVCSGPWNSSHTVRRFLSLPFRLLLDLNVTIDLESLNVKWLHVNCSNCLKMCTQVKPDPCGHCRLRITLECLHSGLILIDRRVEFKTAKTQLIGDPLM